MIFGGTKLVLSIRSLRVLYDKNVIRKDETFEVFAGDQLFGALREPIRTLYVFFEA